MTHIREGARLQVQQPELLHNLDLSGFNGDRYSILKVHRQAQTLGVIECMTQLMVPALPLIGGYFNVRHRTFEPGSISANRRAVLVR